MRIGVFDSGKGGMFIAERLRELLPEHEYVVVDDSAHVPYGTRPLDEIIELADRAIQPLLADCPIIVIACNTITTGAIHTLRERYPNTLFVGLEPMIKPASQLTKSRHVTMLATPRTLESQRYHTLKEIHAGDLIVSEPATEHWPRMIEDGLTETILLDEIATAHEDGADVIVLGCTHYLALIPQLRQLAPGATILEPSEAIARRLRQLVARQTTSSDQYD